MSAFSNAERPPEPVFGLEPEGRAWILICNVPDPTSYSGRNYIRPVFDAPAFASGAVDAIASLRNAADDPREPANSLPGSKAVRLSIVSSANGEQIDPGEKDAPIAAVVRMAAASVDLEVTIGGVLASITSPRGKNLFHVAAVGVAEQHLLLVESLRLANCLGSCGAGRTIQRFILLLIDRRDGFRCN